MPPWHDALELSEECWQLAKHSSTKYCKNWAAYECRCKCMNPHVCNTCFFFFITSYYIFTQKKNSVKTPKSKQFVHVHAKNHAKLSCSIFDSFWLHVVFAVAFWTGHRLYCHAATSGQCHRAAVAPVQLHVSVSPSPSAQAGSRVSSGHPSVDKAVARASSMLSVWKCENVSVMSLAQT